VSSLDLAATFLAAAKAPPMKDADGVDLLPYLEPKISGGGPDRALFWRFHTQWCIEDAVRRGPWKWVRSMTKNVGVLKKGEPSLFNIDDDPSEQHNLASKYPEITDAMEKEFSGWNKTLPDPQWTTVQRIR
jgi:arylsulfatase A-like enzyme